MFKVLRSLLPAMILVAPLHAAAEGPMDRAVSTTRTLLSQAHQAMAGPNDVGALRRAIATAFDFQLWEQFLLQDRAGAFTPAQRAEFRRLLPGYMANLYVEQFDRGLHAAPEVGQARKVRRDFLVATRFKRGDGRDLPVEWRLRHTPGGDARVIDVMVGGTSFLLLRREEFRAIIDKSGADGLLDYMRRNAR